MKKISLLLSIFVMVFGVFFFASSASAATILSDGFGTGGDTTTVSGWSEGGNSGDDAELRSSTSGNDSASPNGGRFAVMLGDGGYICRTVNTTGYNNVQLSYYWRGDADSGPEVSDDAKVEIKPSSGNNCSDGSGWTELQDHDMRIDSSWSTQSSVIHASMNNTSFLIRFRVSTNQNDEHFRVDGVLITGDAIVSTGNLQVTKNTIGGNGTFSFTGAESFNITTSGNTGSNTITGLTPGNYTITETVPVGWDQTSNTCTSVVVTAGNTATCTITNTKRGSITVYKNVLNPNEDEVSDDQSFSVTLNGANTQSISENSSYAYSNLVPGVYTVEENVNADYDFMSFSTDADPETSGAQVTVVAGTNLNLTITNKQKMGTVTVNKIVTNPNGGSAVAGDFSFSINSGDAIQFIQDLGNSLLGSNIFNWNPGAVNITETVGQYAISYNGCSFVLASNGNNTCTITNSDIPADKGAITVVKNILNDNGGTKTVSDFNLYIGETMVTSGQSNFLDPGEYTVSEGTLPSGYTQTSIVCSNGVDTTSGTVNLTAQSSWICTITNDDQPAQITIVKNTINTAWNGALDGDFSFNLSGQAEPIVLTTSEGTAETTFELNAGAYTLTENVPSDWNLSSISCELEGDEVVNGVMLSLDNGESVTCIFTNTRKVGTLLVKKVVVNDDNLGDLSAGDFGFTVNGSEPIGFIQDEEDPLKGAKQIILVPGVYDISEPVAEGYFKVPENCSPASILEGEESVCIFRNDDVGFFVHSGGGSEGGSVLGASIENTDEPKDESTTEQAEGEVLGDAIEACGAYLNQYLFFGKKNNPEEVKKLQTFLNENLGLSLKVDGVYGRATRNAVKTFQEKYKDEILTPWVLFGLKDGQGTGNVYKTTLRWINMMKCSSLNIPMPQIP